MGETSHDHQTSGCCGGHHDHAGHSHDHDHHDHGHGHEQATADIRQAATVPVDGTVKDPVCGMTVTLGKGKPSLTYKGDDYHFCSQKCHDRFEADPYFYLSGNKARKKTAAPKNALYTCPMDPEIVQEGPGTCPICGMALEPMDGVR